jgi:hypothetical protein
MVDREVAIFIVHAGRLSLMMRESSVRRLPLALVEVGFQNRSAARDISHCKVILYRA